jgi:DNA ligase (NAD+)
MSPAEQIARLREQIERANNAYYILDAPEISDAEYDRSFASSSVFTAEELAERGTEHPPRG